MPGKLTQVYSCRYRQALVGGLYWTWCTPVSSLCLVLGERQMTVELLVKEMHDMNLMLERPSNNCHLCTTCVIHIYQVGNI